MYVWINEGQYLTLGTLFSSPKIQIQGRAYMNLPYAKRLQDEVNETDPKTPHSSLLCVSTTYWDDMGGQQSKPALLDKF